MVSYWRTQWWRILMAIACLITAGIVVCTSTATADTIEGLADLTGDLFSFYTWLAASILWLFMSILDYNYECNKRRFEEQALEYERLKERVDALSGLIANELHYVECLEQKVRMLEEELRQRR
jgi:hypothetical protein